MLEILQMQGRSLSNIWGRDKPKLENSKKISPGWGTCPQSSLPAYGPEMSPCSRIKLYSKHIHVNVIIQKLQECVSKHELRELRAKYFSRLTLDFERRLYKQNSNQLRLPRYDQVRTEQKMKRSELFGGATQKL